MISINATATSAFKRSIIACLSGFVVNPTTSIDAVVQSDEPEDDNMVDQMDVIE
jgi:hypothetical protein